MDNLKVLEALRELKKNDDKIVVVSREMRRIDDNFFVENFPSQYGIQVYDEDWGMRIIGPPALARENNNCWSVIEQMDQWKRWFRLIGVERSVRKGQRLLIETVHHAESGLHFVPNSIETHPITNTVTTLFCSDDNMSRADHSISIEKDSKYGQEYCEMRIGVLPETGGFPSADSGSSGPLPPLPERLLDDEICGLFDSVHTLPDFDLIKLYHLLLMKDRVIRHDLPYEIMEVYYTLRRRSLAKKKVYQKILDKNPFCILETGTPTIAIKAPFRSCEEYASDLFIMALYRFLSERRSWCGALQDGPYDLTILNKSVYPDGDNTPFDKVFSTLKTTFMIPMNDRINIRYAPNMGYGVCLVLTPGEALKSSP